MAKLVLLLLPARREDPFVLLIRYLSLMGIRVVDLFRMFDKNNDLFITKEKFVQGLQVQLQSSDKECNTFPTACLYLTSAEQAADNRLVTYSSLQELSQTVIFC